MIIQEATIGGTVYCEWDEKEMALPESERVSFDYGAISNRDKIDLMHKSYRTAGFPNGADVCLAAIDGKGKKIRNLKKADGTVLDTVAKCLEFNDADNFIANVIELVGYKIWRRQSGEEVELKN